MAASCVNTFRPSSVFPRNIATSTFAGSATSRPKSQRTAASRSARRSRPTISRARTCAKWFNQVAGLFSVTSPRPPIAPYDSTRKDVREMIEPGGGFILVHLATPLEVCEERDRKGLYAKARAGILKEFTGISDPYELPADVEVTVDTGELSPEEAAQQIILHLEREGFVGINGGAAGSISA